MKFGDRIRIEMLDAAGRSIFGAIDQKVVRYDDAVGSLGTTESGRRRPMKLYGYFRSSAAFRVRIALNLKGIAVEHAFRHLRKGEQRRADYLAINPQGLVPALEPTAGAC